MNRNSLISFVFIAVLLCSAIGLQAQQTVQKTPYQKRVEEIGDQALKKMGTTKEQLAFNMMAHASIEDGLSAIFEVAMIKDECLYLASKVEKYCNTIVFNKAEICEWYRAEMKKAESLKNAVDRANEQKKRDEEQKRKQQYEKEVREQAFASTDEGQIHISVNNNFSRWMKKGEFEPATEHQQRLKDSSLIVFRQIYSNVVQDKIISSNGVIKPLEGKLTYNTEKEMFSVSCERQYSSHGKFESFIRIPLSEAQKFKEQWNKSENDFVAQDWCFVNRKLHPRIIRRTIDGQTYILPVQKIFQDYPKQTFTPKDFREISLTFNSLGINNEYLRNVVLLYSDIEQQFVEQVRLVLIKCNDDKYGYYTIIPCKYDMVYSFVEGFAPVSIGGKWGYIDKIGNEVIPCIYDKAYSFSEGFAIVKLNDKYGYVDRMGNEVIPCKYESGYGFSEGLALVKLNDRWHYIDRNGNRWKYEEAYSFSEGLAPVMLNGKWGYIGKDKNEVIPIKYEKANAFFDGLAPVKLDDKWGYIDKTGNEIIPFKLKYDIVGYFSENLAPVKLDGKWGYIDRTGEEIIPLKYNVGRDFSEGLAPVYLNSKWGYIDKTGEEITPFIYDTAISFSEGLALVKLDGKWGYIDKTGKKITLFQYDWARSFFEGFARVKFDGKYGFINTNGSEIIPCIYDEAWPFSDGLARVKFDGEEFYINKTGKTGKEKLDATLDLAYSKRKTQIADEKLKNAYILPFALVEVKPMFQGKDAREFTQWIYSQPQYQEALRSNIQGTARIYFIVNKDGSLSDIESTNTVDPLLKKYAIEIVGKSPKWTPGRQQNEPVDVSYQTTIVFKSQQ